MVELVDTLVSGTSAVKGMEVQVFFWANLDYFSVMFVVASQSGGGGLS